MALQAERPIGQVEASERALNCEIFENCQLPQGIFPSMGKSGLARMNRTTQGWGNRSVAKLNAVLAEYHTPVVVHGGVKADATFGRAGPPS